MKAERWVPLIGFFATDFVVLWLILSLAAGQGAFSGQPVVWIVSLGLSAFLTILLARRLRRRDP